MMKILFCGNVYGAGNIGDDAILEGFVTEFKKLKEDVEIGAISMAPEHTKSTIDIDYVWGNKLSDEKKAVKWATHIILGGGTLITDSQNIRYPLKHCCRIVDHAINAGRPISMLATGVSDIKTNSAKRLLNNCIIPYLDLLTVRSEFDRQQAIRAGDMNKEMIDIGADAAFSLKVETKWNPHNIIGLSLVNEGQESIGYAQKIAKALNKFHNENPKYKYMGVCSEIRKDAQFDYPLIKKTLAELNGEHSIQDDYKSPQEFISFLSQCNFVITMRMHVLVFCSLIGVPCITMIREHKMESMLNSLGIKEFLRMSSSEDEIFEKLQSVMSSPENFLPIASNIEQLTDKSKNNLILWQENNTNTKVHKTSKTTVLKKFTAKINTSKLKNVVIYYLGYARLCIKRLIKR